MRSKRRWRTSCARCATKPPRLTGNWSQVPLHGSVTLPTARIEEAAQSSRDTKDAMDYAATAARPFVGVDLAKDKPTFVCATIAPGNAAAMREALEKFLDFSRRGLAFVTSYRYTEAENEEIDAAFDGAKAALSSPPRNCDVGTAEEQCRRHQQYCDATRDSPLDSHRCMDAPTCSFCFANWAQMLFAPAEGGAE